jgi:CDP-diacylglycerol--glycerol-3-phosphate 3-phosphatidyltransferase
MNTANKITIFRILIIPFFLVALFQANQVCSYIALVIFIIASATDGVDGYVARKYNQITNFGKFMDPLADKLLVASALISFVQFGFMPAWAVIVIIAREFTITSLRVVAISQGAVIAASMSGKFKTVVQILAVCVTLFFSYTKFDLGGFTNMTLIYIVTLICVLVTIYSGIDYLIRNRKVINMN